MNWRQKFHLEPPKGFLNDPNGLCYFKGEYHIYFQYCKNSVDGNDLKSWGHYKTKDFKEYKFTGEPILPDIAEDRNGAYSGSTLIYNDKMYIYYTGNVKENGNFDYINEGRGANTILVKSSDGDVMSDKQVLLRNEDYPKNCSCHVRDPKVWVENGEVYMVLGARDLESKGLVLFYKSIDGENFEYVSSVSQENFGYMWECPDYFALNGQNYLSISPQGLEHFETKNQNIYQSGYTVAKGNLKKLELSDFFEWDMGFDFYAPQTFEDDKNRRILIGWMGLPDADYINHTTKLGFQHCLTVPRVITKNKDNSISQKPIEEIDRLRTTSIEMVSKETKKISLPFDLYGKINGDFCVNIDNKLKISYADELVKLEFLDEVYGGGRKIRKLEISKCDDIRILADMSSLEIFLDDGKKVMTTRFYPDEDVNISIENFQAEIYKLQAFDIKEG